MAQTKIRTTNTKFASDTSCLEIPKGTDAQRVNSDGSIRFNTTSDNFEYFDGGAWVALEGTPSISSISPTNVREIDSATTTNFIVTGSTFKPSISAVLVGDDGTEVAFDSVTRDSSTQLTCVMTNNKITDPNEEPYDIKVTNPSGNTFTLANQVNINNLPYFNTASGQLGSTQRFGPFSETIQAVDPESTAVTFRIVVGALPAGFSLNSATGEISATSWTLVAADETYNFTVEVEDTASNVSRRAFSIILGGPVSESFTSSGTFSVPTGVTAVEALVVASGGGGGTGHGGGGGAGGLVYHATYPVTPGGSEPVTIGGTPGDNAQGIASTFGTMTTVGGGTGGTGGHEGGQGVVRAGGSGGGGGRNQGSSAGTQGPSGGGTGFGNPGASGPSQTGGGGGGAGAAGSGKNGGIGKSYTLADGTSPVYYAGGGGGGGAGGVPGGPGGQGGGGGGSGPYYDSASPGGDGGANRGGGGGGGVRGTTMQGMSIPPSQGGSGIVIVRY